MDEELQFAADGFADRPDVFKGKLSFENQPGESQTFQPSGLLRCPDSTLGGCVEGNPDIFVEISDSSSGHFHHGHVLDYDGVGSGLLYIQHEPVCVLQFRIVEYGVQCDEYPGTETVRIFTKPPDVFNVVSGSLSCSELRPGYIHSIGTAVNCRDADLQISCRSKQFQSSHF